MIKEFRMTSSIRRGKIAQSTNKSLVHHGLDVIVRLGIISMIAPIVRIISVVESNIIPLILIVRIDRVCRIVRLVIPLAILVLQSYLANPFEVTLFGNYPSFGPLCCRSG